MADESSPNPYAALFGGLDPDRHEVRVAVEPREISTDRSARIKREYEDARHRRWRETITHTSFVAGLVVIGVICIAIVRDPDATPQRFQWAAASLSAILAGATGFLAGKSKG